MANSVPPGYELMPPDVEIDPPLGGTPPPASPGAPQANTIPPGYGPLPPDAQPDASQQPYQSTIWPFRRDASGLSWDPHAGILGSAIDAFTLPGDVLTGKQATPYTGGSAQPDPSLLQRTENLATFASPTGVAGRVGIAPAGTTSAATRTGDIPLSLGTSVSPTGRQLRDAVDTGFDAARASPVTIPSSSTASYSTALQQKMFTDHGLVPKTAPETFSVLNDLTNPAGAQTRFIDLEAAREQLSAIANSNTANRDPFAAKQAIPHIDNLIDTSWPDATVARRNSAAAKRADALTGELTAANTGVLERGDTAAQLRQRVNTLTESAPKTRGYTDDEIASLDAFSKTGGRLPLGLSWVGNVLGGGPGKLVSAGAGTLLGAHLGGVEGATAGLLTAPWIGEALKGWEFSRAKSQLDAIGETLRSRSPLGEQYAGSGAGWPNTPVRAPYTLLNQAVAPIFNPYQPPPQPAQAPGPVPQGGAFTPQIQAPRFAPLPTTGPIPQGLLSPWA